MLSRSFVSASQATSAFAPTIEAYINSTHLLSPLESSHSSNNVTPSLSANFNSNENASLQESGSTQTNNYVEQTIGIIFVSIVVFLPLPNRLNFSSECRAIYCIAYFYLTSFELDIIQFSCLLI